MPDVELLASGIWMPQKQTVSTLVVYWWASWCPFCALQSPHIGALWQTQKATGLGVLALLIDKLQSMANAYLKSKGYTFAADIVTLDVAKMLPKPKGLPGVLVLKINKVKTRQRHGCVGR